MLVRVQLGWVRLMRREDDTYDLRLGWVVDPSYNSNNHPPIDIGGQRWATRSGLVCVLPDACFRSDHVPDNLRELPPGVSVAMTQYDGMVVL